MGNRCSPGCRWWCLCWRLFVLSFYPLDVLDENWDLTESVSEGCLAYSPKQPFFEVSMKLVEGY